MHDEDNECWVPYIFLLEISCHFRHHMFVIILICLLLTALDLRNLCRISPYLYDESAGFSWCCNVGNETNHSPNNRPLEKEIPIGTIFFRVHVSFRGVIRVVGLYLKPVSFWTHVLHPLQATFIFSHKHRDTVDKNEVQRLHPQYLLRFSCFRYCTFLWVQIPNLRRYFGWLYGIYEIYPNHNISPT